MKNKYLLINSYVKYINFLTQVREKYRTAKHSIILIKQLIRSLRKITQMNTYWTMKRQFHSILQMKHAVKIAAL